MQATGDCSVLICPAAKSSSHHWLLKREQTEAGNMMKAAVMAKARVTVDCSKGNEPIKKLDHHQQKKGTRRYHR
jgi:hypothetical protein